MRASEMNNPQSTDNASAAGPNDNVRSEVTLLLREWAGGDERALDRLMPLVYDELRAVAHRRLAACVRRGFPLDGIPSGR